jgi:hypothetical protein
VEFLAAVAVEETVGLGLEGMGMDELDLFSALSSPILPFSTIRLSNSPKKHSLSCLSFTAACEEEVEFLAAVAVEETVGLGLEGMGMDELDLSIHPSTTPALQSLHRAIHTTSPAPTRHLPRQPLPLILR